MKKPAIILAAFLAFAFPGFAQDAANEDLNSPETETSGYGKMILINKFSDNWEISARIGTQAYLGEYLDPYIFKFGDWWTFPALDFSFQKWCTNSVGVGVGFTWSKLKNLYVPGKDIYAPYARDNDPVYSKDPGFKVQSGSMGNVYVQALFNMCNILGGYKANRFYNAVITVGGGFMFPTVSTNYRECSPSFNAGFNNKFRIASHLTLDIDFRGTLHSDTFNGIAYYTGNEKGNLSVDATFGATVGLSYRFNWTKGKQGPDGRRINEEGWTTVDDIAKKTSDYKNLKAEADAVSAALAATNAALADANGKIAAQEKAIRAKDAIINGIPADKPFSYRQLVNFVIGRWAISNREKVSIMLAAEIIKQHPDTKFIVAGYADVQTASPAHNMKLSKNRADVVYNCLVNEFGINPDQLEKAYCGGVDYMFFNDEQCSRSVLITTIDSK